MELLVVSFVVLSAIGFIVGVIDALSGGRSYNGHRSSAHNPNPGYRSMSSLSNPNGWYNPASPNNVGKSMSSLSNPNGWYNPSSPNYVWKKH